MNQMIAPNRLTTPLTPAEARVRFTGGNQTFGDLVTRGALLELVTFGFYRFWLTTAMRRHLWANTNVEGDAPEYTGHGRELLIGFLFAAAIMVPLYIGYFLLQVEASRISQFASIPLVVIALGVLKFAEYRAWRYRLTRTVWRGIRFSMTGSGVGFALRAFAWQLLVILTLGLAYPWRAAALERYKMANTSYGNLQGRFEATGWTFFKRGFPVWIAFAALGLLFASTTGWLVRGFSTPDVGLDPARLVLSIVALGIVALGASFLYPTFQAIQWKWWLEGLRVGELNIRSDLRVGSIVGNTWAMIGAVIGVSLALLTFGIVYIVALVGVATNGDWIASLGARVDATWLPYIQTVLSAVAYLPFILAFGVIRRIYLMQRVWKIVAGSATLCGLDTAVLADMRTIGRPVGALGEGLADGFDLAGF